MSTGRTVWGWRRGELAGDWGQGAAMCGGTYVPNSGLFTRLNSRQAKVPPGLSTR